MDIGLYGSYGMQNQALSTAVLNGPPQNADPNRPTHIRVMASCIIRPAGANDALGLEECRFDARDQIRLLLDHCIDPDRLAEPAPGDASLAWHSSGARTRGCACAWRADT